RYQNLDGVLGNEAAVYTTGLHTGYGDIAFDPGVLADGESLGLIELIFEFRDFFGSAGTDFNPVVDGVSDLPFAPYFFDRYLAGAGFGSDGGDIRVAVGGDIVGARSTQLATDWLATIGGERISLLGVDSPAPTVWAVRYDRFRQSLGTLGGGDISITAAGSANDLSVMLPTTGRPDGDGIHYSPFEGIFT